MQHNYVKKENFKTKPETKRGEIDNKIGTLRNGGVKEGSEVKLPVIRKGEGEKTVEREAVGFGAGGGDVFVVLAHLGEGPAGVFAGEHGVGAAGAVKGFSSAGVVDATHSLLVIEPLHLPRYPLLLTLTTQLATTAG